MQTIALNKTNFIDTIAILTTAVKQKFKIKILIEKKEQKKDFFENSNEFNNLTETYINDRKKITYKKIKENMKKNPNKFDSFISKE